MKKYPQKKSSNFFTSFMLVLALLCLSAAGIIGYHLLDEQAGGQKKAVIIERGMPISKIAVLLHSEGIIRQPELFRFLLRLTGGSQKVRAGEFEFKEGMSAISALYVLYYDKPILHQVTIPEGRSVSQIADILARTGLVQKDRFLELTLSPQNAERFKIKAPSLEGFLFPDTYHFSKIDRESKIIETMVKQFFSRYTDEQRNKALKMGFSTVQLITLASIIEKETGASAERELIASVFHNRLKKNMRLQSDPTTIYGIKNFDGNLTKKDLQTSTPYNTYKIKGLPPGPIANPGWAAIQAALEPATTDYLYFVSNNKGGHIFSRSYAEHMKNVDKFQKSGFFRRYNASSRQEP